MLQTWLKSWTLLRECASLKQRAPGSQLSLPSLPLCCRGKEQEGSLVLGNPKFGQLHSFWCFMNLSC